MLNYIIEIGDNLNDYWRNNTGYTVHYEEIPTSTQPDLSIRFWNEDKMYTEVVHLSALTQNTHKSSWVAAMTGKGIKILDEYLFKRLTKTKLNKTLLCLT